MKLLRILQNLAILLAFTVLALGAYTRLTNAGLGCPDWPGCYGQMRLSTLVSEHRVAQARFPDQPIELQKARAEMIHRYAAGTLILMVFGSLCVTIFLRRRGVAVSLGLPVFSCLWILCQAVLGMWTVTWRLLPWVVMTHLMFGAILFASLVLFRCKLTFECLNLKDKNAVASRCFFIIAVGLVALQMLLGGWVSANYAGVACVGFPTCNGEWFPTGYLPTIQMIHRLGALLVTLYLSGLMVYMRHMKGVWLLGVLLGVQLLLGLVNVLYFLPLPIAVMHNLVAVLLFTTCVVFAWGRSCK